MSNAVLRGGMGKRHLLVLPRRQIKGKEKGVLRKKKVCRPWKAQREEEC